MTFFPNTLLGRTALYLGVLLVVVQALWFATAQYLMVTRVGPAYEQQIVDMVAMAQGLIEAQPSDADLESAQVLRIPSFDFLEIVPDSHPRPELTHHHVDDIPGDLSDGLQERFGPSALSLREADAETSWLRFPARGQLFWLKIPLSPTETISHAKILFVGLEIALAVGGAYLIVFRLTKKLRYVTEAAKAIGRGNPPETLEVSGPEEIRTLCAGINQMSQDLVKLEADRRLMLAGISHDLRTPLTRLRIAVELANNNVDPAMIQDIEDMDAILGQFLDYARDGSEEKPVEADLNEIVRETCQRYTQAGHGIRVDVENVPEFAFRPLALRRVVTNLVENAVRYGREHIEVRTQLAGDRACLEVADRGPGVAPDRLREIGRPFVRESPARSEFGAGLGLAIVDRIARAHGGRVELRNRPEGGFLVRVELQIRHRT